MKIGSKLSIALASVGLLAGLTACGSVKGAEYVKGTPVKVGLICLHDSTSTYDANFIDALKEAVKDLGSDKVVFEDNCLLTGVDETEECYDAAKDLVKKGCNVIFADSFGHQEFMLKAAKEWPTVQFCHATGTNAKTANLDNYHNAFASIYEGRYLAGYAAGLRLLADNQEAIYTGTWEGAKLGYVGAFTYAEVVSGYTSWFLGVRDVFRDMGNGLEEFADKITMDVQFTGSWYDPTGEADAATALASRGAVLISQHADSMGAPGVCEEKGIPNVSYNISTKDKNCSETYLAHSRINWAPYYKAVVESLYNGTATTGETNHNWTGDLLSESVEYNIDWDNVLKNIDADTKGYAKPVMELMVSSVEAELLAGTRKVFDTSKFTVTVVKEGDNKKNVNATVDADGHLTAYQADTDGDFAPDTNVIVAASEDTPAYFNESFYCSAPYFDINIDGITLVNTKF